MTPRPKRFYRVVSVDDTGAPPAFRVLLNGKPARTPGKAELALPSRALAEAVAGEWRAQSERIYPSTMPLTRLVNSAIDGVRGRQNDVRADICKYAASDLLCYRAEGPVELVRRQAQAWDPVLAWAREALGVHLVTGQGIVPVTQPPAANAAIESALARLDAFALTAHHVMTTLTGSALLALAHGGGGLSAEQAWVAAHIDEDWQIEKWGWDAEAKTRRTLRWAEMQAAGRLLALLGR
jgi:chaperone required for assembly of F1-ATPase